MVYSNFTRERFWSLFRTAAWLFGFLFIFALIVPAANLQAEPSQTPEDKEIYEFGPGDVLAVYVYEEPEISQTVTVRSDGRISLPLVGDVEAAGRTPEGLAQKISQKLEKFVEAPEVTVILTQSRPKVYYILGQVKSPGEYSIDRQVTVLQAIARAGGFTEWAKKSRIMVVKAPEAEKAVLYFDYDKFLDEPAEERNVELKAGDTIVVP